MVTLILDIAIPASYNVAMYCSVLISESAKIIVYACVSYERRDASLSHHEGKGSPALLEEEEPEAGREEEQESHHEVEGWERHFPG